MAFSNSLGYLVLATGNKSELSLGYATLYGDMVGGFAVIKDLTKRWVYQVARYLKEKEGYPIPDGIFHRPPTAELRENQTDEGDLYPYRVIDTVVEGYVEKSLTLQELLKEGLQEEVVKKILERIDQNEYKRRQAPIGIRITPRALGKDWRMPIVNRFRRS
jgi:NAD+ synthase (glutamine-hydrolysing)